MTSFWKVFISIIITLVISAGGTWYIADSIANQKLTAKDDQILSLQTALDTTSAKLKTATATTSTTTTTDETADWKTYTNSTYGFSFKYPTNWSQDIITSTDLKNIKYSLLVFAGPGASKNIERGGPYGIVNTYVYDSLSSFATDSNVTGVSLKTVLNNISAASDPIITGVSEVKIGNKNGFVATAGPNTYGGGIYYYVQDESGRIYKVHFFTSSESYKTSVKDLVLSTFQFTK